MVSHNFEENLTQLLQEEGYRPTISTKKPISQPSNLVKTRCALSLTYGKMTHSL